MNNREQAQMKMLFAWVRVFTKQLQMKMFVIHEQRLR